MGRHTPPPGPGVRRADLAAAAALAALGTLLFLAGRFLAPAADAALRTDGSPGSLEALAGAAAAALGLGLLAWLAAGFLFGLLGALLMRTGRAAGAYAVARCTPAFLRRLAAGVIGVQLLAGAPASAALPPAAASSAAAAWGGAAWGGGGASGASLSGSVPDHGHAGPAPAILDRRGGPGPEEEGQNVGQEPPTLLWQPGRPVDSPGLLARPGSGTGETGETGTVAVRSGDSLWTLAADQLGPLATDVEIARQWPRWYDLNRHVIGPDPDLLLPGQLLTVPPPDPGP